MPLNILVAPSGFKEGLDARAVAAAIACGAARALPAATITRVPLMDGGEGFTRALVDTTSGVLHTVETTDPLGRSIVAEIGFLGGTGAKTAVIEIAAAAGMRLVAPAERDLARASSAGVGHLIRHALDLGAQRMLIGCGDSGVNDAGVGLARSLGARFLDEAGTDIGEGPLALRSLAKIDLSQFDPRIATTEIEVAVNWKNALIGARGVSRVYGPQKGASAELAAALDDALARYALVVKATTGCNVAALPGAGASGGIGAALAGLCGARLIPRFDVVQRYLPFEDRLANADLVLTAEGTIDRQSAYGKIPAEVAARARAKGIPVIALAGSIECRAEEILATGVSACFSIAPGPMTFEQSMREASGLLEAAAEQAVRSFYAGFRAASGAQARMMPEKTFRFFGAA
jgi:glycerate 2-kinase